VLHRSGEGFSLVTARNELFGLYVKTVHVLLLKTLATFFLALDFVARSRVQLRTQSTPELTTFTQHKTA
jgi:hypothetical protein